MSCLNDDGYKEGEKIRAEAVKESAMIRQIAAIAIAIDNSARLISNYKKQRDIADQAMKIAEGEQKQLRRTYWPRELQFLEEFGTREELEDAEVIGRRISGRLLSTVAGAFAREVKKLDCNASRYCTSQRTKQLQDLLIIRSQALTNARILGRIMGFFEVQDRRKINDDRRRQAIALGKNLVGQAASLYSSAGQSLAGIGQDLAGRVSNAFQAIGTNFGQYQDARSRLNQLNATQGMDLSVRQGINTNDTISDGMANHLPGSPVSSFDMVNPNEVSAEYMQYGNPSQLGPNPAIPGLGPQSEVWNAARVGNRDLARSGSKTYTFTDSDGDRGEIVVSMDDFPLKYVDDKYQGDT